MYMIINMEETGAFIRQLRKDAGMTQEELGERMSVSAQSVSNWERGESLPDVAALPDLAQVLHCSVDAILSGGAAGPYRRHVTVSQMREAVGCIRRMRDLLGEEQFMVRCMLDALSTRMNTDIPAMLNDAHCCEVLVCECLIACAEAGDYVDPRDVQLNIQPCRAREFVLSLLQEKGFR